MWRSNAFRRWPVAPGVREDRDVVCWGRSGYGVLEPTLPIVLDAFSDVVQPGMAYDAVCALDGAGKVAFIGHPDNNGSPDPLPEGCIANACTRPVPLKLENVVELGGGAAVVVARLKDGTYRAWGSNDVQIGNGKASPYFVKVPEKVLDLPPP